MDENKGKSKGYEEERKLESCTKLSGVLIFGIIGATATTIAVVKLRQLWRTIDFVYAEFTRSWPPGRQSGGKSFRSSFQEEAWKKYTRRMQEECEDERERVERIRRMQSVFHRERNKNNRAYESWKENNQGTYHQHFQRDDWYWKTDKDYKDHEPNFRRNPGGNASYLLSHHYAVLGLDRSRTKPYSESEIKTAFRTKAKEFHPDQNQENKQVAEEKFKEIMTSYEAIKKERNT